MTRQSLFLGIDCGTQGTKAIVLDAASGWVLGLGAAAHPSLISGANGRREQHPQEWLDALTRVHPTAPCSKPAWTARTFSALAFPASNMAWCCSTIRARCCARPSCGATPKPARKTPGCCNTWAVKAAPWSGLACPIAPGYTVSKLLWTLGNTRRCCADRPSPVAPRLPQLVAHRPCLRRVWRRLGYRLFQCAHPAMGLPLLRHVDPSGRLEAALPTLIRSQSGTGRCAAGDRRAPGDQSRCHCVQWRRGQYDGGDWHGNVLLG